MTGLLRNRGALIRTLFPLAIGLIGLAAAACAGGSEEGGRQTPPAGRETPPVTSEQLTIAAVPTIKWDKKELTVAGGQAVILFDNQDTGVSHNFAVYSDPEFSQAVAKTDICAAPCQETLTLQDLSPGEYYYQCDVHPVDSMRGSLRVR